MIFNFKINYKSMKNLNNNIKLQEFNNYINNSIILHFFNIKYNQLINLFMDINTIIISKI